MKRAASDRTRSARRSARDRAAILVAAGLAPLLGGCGEDEIVVFRFGSGGANALVPFGGTTSLPNGSGGASAGGRSATGGVPVHPTHSGGTRGGGSGGASQPASGGAQAAGGSSGGTTSSGGAPAGTGGVAEAGSATSCASESDCPSGWTCSKSDCSAPTGACEPRPVLCDLTPRPVCGCDRVTYWNDCVRRQNGVPASTGGQCSFGALACNTAADCGVPGAFCSHVFPSPVPCTQPGPGTCWMIPIDCTGAPPSPLWIPCSSSPFGTLPKCVDTCTAIQSGEVYVPVPVGMTCP